MWEVRSTLPGDRIARLILCFHQQTLVVLHGFIKKTRKTPAQNSNWLNADGRRLQNDEAEQAYWIFAR
jgi:phage-related protein